MVKVERKRIILDLVVLMLLFCFLLNQNVSGFQIDLTRKQVGDCFNNPYVKDCYVDDETFCLGSNSLCFRNYPELGNKCCYCHCNIKYSTFNLKTSRCARNEDYRQVCSFKIAGQYDEDFLLSIDLTKSGQRSILPSGLPNRPQNKLLSCPIRKVEQMSSNGYETVSGHPFGTGPIRRTDFDMTWPGASKDKDVHGKVYRITFNCQYKNPGSSNGQITGCLMLKTTGTVRIDHPGLPEKSSSVFARSSEPTTEISSPSSSPSLPLSPSTTPTPSEFLSTQSFKTTSPWTIHSSSQEILVIPSSTKDISPSITQWPLSPSSVKEEQVDLFTNIEHRDSVEAVISFSTCIFNTVSPTSFPRNEKQISENDENTLVYVIVPIVVVVVVIVTFAVVRFTMIREKKKMTKKCESKSNIIMSDLNNGKNEKDELYTDLDRSADNAESNYQALTFSGAVNKRQTITTNAYNKNMRQVQNANDCIYADADRVYSTIEPEITDDGKQGAKINKAFDVNENDHEYSILEQTEQGTISCPTSIQQNPSASVHACTVDTAPIYVYFEDDKKNKITSAADYVTILSPEPCQLNGSLYADLSDQRGGGNQYESLVKRKK